MKTLKQYRDFCVVVFGEDSPQVRFLDAKIAEQGEDMEVVAHESQMLILLASMSK